MADKAYVNETQTVRFEIWDRRISPDKPDREEPEPDPSPWLSGPQISEITALVKKSGLVIRTLTLTDEDVVPTGRPGEWRIRFLADQGKGDYLVDMEAVTVDNYVIVDVKTIKVELRK